MPVATPEQYAEMLDRAKAGGFAYPAFNAASSQSVNAILQGLTEAGSDGIIQVTTGGADYFAGHTVKARATGALAFAKFAHEVAKSYPITVALHTDHCPKPALEDFVLPLVAASEQAVADGGHPIFQSHMWDGSAVPLGENIDIAKELLPGLKAINAILEVEIGVVGGEEDGVQHEGSNDALHDHRRRVAGRRSPRPRRSGPLDRRAHVRQRARRLQARQREAAPGTARRDPGRHRIGVRHRREAARPGLPRRQRLDLRRDRARSRERRRQDEHRHRHPVRLHACGRRLHVQELRRRPQGRRRSGQQEGLRPARLGQGRRDRAWPLACSRPTQQLGSFGKSQS